MSQSDRMPPTYVNRETVVKTESSNTGMIITAIVIAAVVVIGLFYFVNRSPAPVGDTTTTTITTPAPDATAPTVITPAPTEPATPPATMDAAPSTDAAPAPAPAAPAPAPAPATP